MGPLAGGDGRHTLSRRLFRRGGMEGITSLTWRRSPALRYLTTSRHDVHENGMSDGVPRRFKSFKVEQMGSRRGAAWRAAAWVCAGEGVGWNIPLSVFRWCTLGSSVEREILQCITSTYPGWATSASIRGSCHGLSEPRPVHRSQLAREDRSTGHLDTTTAVP